MPFNESAHSTHKPAFHVGADSDRSTGQSSYQMAVSLSSCPKSRLVRLSVYKSTVVPIS
jgi:hypothetical protein